MLQPRRRTRNAGRDGAVALELSWVLSLIGEASDKKAWKVC